MQFVPTDQGSQFTLAPSTTITLGRQPQYHLTSAKVSRQHVELTCSADGQYVTAMARKRVEVKRLSTGAVVTVQAGQECQLSPGDALYLERDGNTLKSGFTLSAAIAAVRTSPAGKVKRPFSSPASASKRVKSESISQKLEDSKTLHTAAAPAHSTASEHKVITPNSPAVHEQQQGDVSRGIFDGVCMVVWDHHHTQKAVTLAVHAGARIDVDVSPSTTHVLTSYSVSYAEAEKLLHGSTRQQQAVTTAGSSGGPCNSQACLRDTQHQRRLSSSQLHNSQLDQGSEQQLQEQLQQSHLKDCAHEHIDDLLARGMHFVTVKWLTDSLAAGRLLDEQPYHAQLHQYRYHLTSPTSRQPSRQPSTPLVDAATHMQQADASTAAAAAKRHAIKVKVEPEQQQLLLQDSSQVGDDKLPQDRLSKHQHEQDVSVELQQKQQSLLQASTATTAVLLSRKQQSIAPEASQICRPGEEWGTGGRWIEPWDDAAARNTVEQLLSHWHRSQSQRRQRAAATAAATVAAATAVEADGTPDPDDNSLTDAVSSEDGGLSSDNSAAAVNRQRRRLQHYRSAAAAAASAAVNTVCEHVACSGQTFCFVAELDKLKGTYSRGREDQFRIKAANRAIHELEKTDKPIMTAADVAALGIGEKTTDKVIEILQTGKLRRNEEVAGSERHQVMALFMTVWGVAESTAEKWYQAGCRTLQDVKDKVEHLTTQQRVGLKYFDDFEQRIPRDEVAEAERIVYEAVADALMELTDMSRSEVTHLMHARVTGSYLEGRRTCGDIDFIISPGPAAADLVGMGPLMQGILRRLEAQGCITQDMLPLEPRKSLRGPHDELTWMGVWRGPSSPCYRRVDIKLYPRDQLAFAVNYFASGQDMCRALRYWCNNPVPRVAAAAAALNPAGNAFRLSDRDLVVINRQYEGVPNRRMEAASAATQDDQPEPSRKAASAAAAQDSTFSLQTAANLGSSRMGNGGRGAVRETIVGPAIRCTCETDIFRAIGLAYVPPHMRDII